jgi:hypothetical protein
VAGEDALAGIEGASLLVRRRARERGAGDVQDNNRRRPAREFRAGLRLWCDGSLSFSTLLE